MPLYAPISYHLIRGWRPPFGVLLPTSNDHVLQQFEADMPADPGADRREIGVGSGRSIHPYNLYPVPPLILPLVQEPNGLHDTYVGRLDRYISYCNARPFLWKDRQNRQIL